MRPDTFPSVALILHQALFAAGNYSRCADYFRLRPLQIGNAHTKATSLLPVNKTHTRHPAHRQCWVHLIFGTIHSAAAGELIRTLTARRIYIYYSI